MPLDLPVKVRPWELAVAHPAFRGVGVTSNSTNVPSSDLSNAACPRFARFPETLAKVGQSCRKLSMSGSLRSVFGNSV